jgi:hypothetical protein
MHPFVSVIRKMGKFVKRQGLLGTMTKHAPPARKLHNSVQRCAVHVGVIVVVAVIVVLVIRIVVVISVIIVVVVMVVVLMLVFVLAAAVIIVVVQEMVAILVIKLNPET